MVTDEAMACGKDVIINEAIVMDGSLTVIDTEEQPHHGSWSWTYV